MAPVRVARAFLLPIFAVTTALAMSGCMRSNGPVATVQPQSDLDSLAYGQVLSQLETPPTVLRSRPAIRGTAAGQLAGRTAPMGVPGW